MPGPIIGLHFMRRSRLVIDTTLGLIHFPHLTMQVKSAASEISAIPQVVFIEDSITVPLMTTKIITAFNDHLSEWITTGTVTPVETFREAMNLIISYSTSTIFDKKVVVRVTNITKLHYSIQKNTQIADFVNLVDTAILSIIPEGDPDLTTYLPRLLKTNKLEKQNSIFWFQTGQNCGKNEDCTPIQTRILKELHNLMLMVTAHIFLS